MEFENIFLIGQLMYFGVKRRDFEGFLIFEKKKPDKSIFGKIYKKNHWGSRGGPEICLCCQMVLVVKF